MKLLGWDTSSKSGAIVALEWEPRCPWDEVRLVSEWSLDVDSRHAERLLWGIHQVLESARWTLSDIDVFLVGTGPGSFTGLRIGITTARTLAHSMGKPLLGVSSLAALARPATLWLKAAKLESVSVIAATDAAKGELFVFLETADGVKEAVAEPVSWIGSLPARAWLAVGEGRKRYPEAWKLLQADLKIEPPVAFSDQIQGRYLGMLGWELCEKSDLKKASPLEVHPRYLRASDAEVKLKAGLLKPSP